MTNSISSVDDDNTGGGEWGGVVVNSIGYHPDCGTGAGADNFCNIEGDWGYFGGLSQAESRGNTALWKDDDINGSPVRTGFSGYAGEAGGAVQESAEPTAAITINAPHLGQTDSPKGSFYSAKNGLELNGGVAGISIAAMGNREHAIYWHSGFAGSFGGASDGSGIIYHDSDFSALHGDGGSGGENGVSLKKLTLVDRSLNAGTAIELAGGGDIAIDNVVVQGFASCLSVGDSLTRVAVSNSVFYCSDATAQAGDGTDYAREAIAQADNFYTLNPDLTPELNLGNATITDVAAAAFGGSASTRIGGHEFALYYEVCYGVGTPLEETVAIGQENYNICELEGQVNDNLYFDDDINGEKVAWRINDIVTLGSDFSELDAVGQRSALEDPQQVIMDGDSKILLSAGSALALNPDVAFRVLGTAENPVELEPQDLQESWDGITVNGLADSCASAEICALAQEQFVDVNYLRLLKAGSGRPALVMNEVSAAGRVNYLDIADSASDGLELNGGAVNIDRLMVADVAGNGVQWSNGYRGTLQYAILQSGDGSLGHALHGTNNAADHDASPRSRPVMANITAKGGESADTAILLEQGSGLLLYNSVVADFDTCLDIDDQSTADLQHTDPAQIHFDNVVLDCEQTVPAEDEDSGMDYATATQGRSGVYEVAAVLDSNFVATGPDIPAIESEIDFSLAGNSANYLDAFLGYMGSVRDSVDDWYLGWSDSVGVLLAAECDFKGVLEDDYVYNDDYITVYAPDGSIVGSHAPSYKVCGLRGTITEDFLLTTYTGVDKQAVQNGEQVVDEYRGYEVERDPLPTLWLLNGLVRVGEGHLELTDPAQVEAMKEDPVTLGIEASAVVMSSLGGGLHITRGGELVVFGDVSLDSDTDTAGPVTLLGLVRDSALPVWNVGEPLDPNIYPWRGLIVDGFGRHNQCPDAMAEPGTRVCNIRGEFGYYGGYDNSHGNLAVENLHMVGGFIQLNSVGGGSRIRNLYQGGDWEFMAVADYGRPVIDIDGGAVNMRHIQIEDPEPSWGSHIRWNHGYQGTLQSLYLVWRHELDDDDDITEISGYEMTLQGDDGNTYFHPVIKGINGEAGHENDLPRSMPTMANLTLFGREQDPHDFEDVRSSMLELSGGSGLFLYNSVIGSHVRYYTEEEKNPNPYVPGYGEMLDYCFKVDESSASLLGTEIVFNQLATDCTELSNRGAFTAALENRFQVKDIVNVSNMANSGTQPAGSLADSDIYRLNWALSNDTADSDFYDILNTFNGWYQMLYPAADLVNLGETNMDYSSSQTVNTDFIQKSRYMGMMDYFVPLEAGKDIVDD